MKTENNTAAEIVMLVTFHVKTEYRKELKKNQIADVRGARMESGNVTMELYESKTHENVLYLFERWTDQQALNAHFLKPYTLDVLAVNQYALLLPMEIIYLEDIAALPDTDHKKSFGDEEQVDLIVTFEVKDGMQDKFLEQFQKSIGLSRPEDGNIAYHLHKIQDDQTHFVLYERWKNQAALDLHFEKPYTIELFDVFNATLTKPLNEFLNFVAEVRS